MKNLDKGISQQERRKLLSILAHASILFSSTIVTIGIPITLMLLAEDDVVIANAREALNFYLTTFLLAICFTALFFVLIGIPLLILLGIATCIMPIFAILKIARNGDRIYRYPLIVRFI